ncbi:MAG: divalent-cation tolerance protein CutA [Corynebacteriales bacterium]|nr:divalent-cation tolerance protein CutA [Mycobacteriales bacterium]
MPSKYCAALTTTDSLDAANKLASSIVAARLAACVQVVGPIRSFYCWEGRVNNNEEYQLWAKTSEAKYAELETHILAEHSYDVPEIIRLPITGGSEAYLSWIDSEVA